MVGSFMRSLLMRFSTWVSFSLSHGRERDREGMRRGDDGGGRRSGPLLDEILSQLRHIATVRWVRCQVRDRE
jgi:hypothetical protein